jgi:hypothetical protein
MIIQIHFLCREHDQPSALLKRDDVNLSSGILQRVSVESEFARHCLGNSVKHDVRCKSSLQAVN